MQTDPKLHRQISGLARKAGYGTADQAVKALLGKNPVSLSRPRAQRIISILEDEIAEAAKADADDWFARHPLHDA